MYDGAVDDAPIKLLTNDLPKREHFDAEHNVANAILRTILTLFSRQIHTKFRPLFRQITNAMQLKSFLS